MRRRIFVLTLSVLIVCTLIMEAGCTGNSSGSIQKGMNRDTLNNDQSTSEAIVPQIVDNLKSMEIENLNDENNLKVIFNLPEGWYAKELIYDKAPDFEYNAEKNKKIKKVYSFEFYNSIEQDKFNQRGIKGLAGEFDVLGYYRDQPESSRFPNHSEVKSRVYSGETALGQGEVFILNCDLLDEMKTDKYSTYDIVYAWIPINNEALAYNLSISVPLGEKDDEYVDMVKKLLNCDPRKIT